MTDIKELSKALYSTSEGFFNSLEWVNSLTPAQRAVHRVHSQLNVDCHNKFLSNIFVKLANTTRYTLAHKGYFKVSNDMERDNTPIPNGVILRRLTNVRPRETSSKGFGRNFNEITGTLFYKSPNATTDLHSCCKTKVKDFDFYHPFYWELPTAEEIEKVLSFSTEKALNELRAIINKTPHQTTEQPIAPTKPSLDLGNHIINSDNILKAEKVVF